MYKYTYRRRVIMPSDRPRLLIKNSRTKQVHLAYPDKTNLEDLESEDLSNYSSVCFRFKPKTNNAELMIGTFEDVTCDHCRG